MKYKHKKISPRFATKATVLLLSGALLVTSCGKDKKKPDPKENKTEESDTKAAGAVPPAGAAGSTTTGADAAEKAAKAAAKAAPTIAKAKLGSSWRTMVGTNSKLISTGAELNQAIIDIDGQGRPGRPGRAAGDAFDATVASAIFELVIVDAARPGMLSESLRILRGSNPNTVTGRLPLARLIVDCAAKINTAFANPDNYKPADIDTALDTLNDAALTAALKDTFVGAAGAPATIPAGAADIIKCAAAGAVDSAILQARDEFVEGVKAIKAEYEAAIGHVTP